MISKKVTIQNEYGIHVRPSGVIISELSNIKSTITLKAKGMELSLMSIMDLLALGLEKNDQLEISSEGDDEEKSLELMADLFEKVYDFPKKE